MKYHEAIMDSGPPADKKYLKNKWKDDNMDKCWYKEVCDTECKPTCIRYMEMKHLVESSGIPAARQYPKRLIPQDCDYVAFCNLADIKDTIDEFVNNGRHLYIVSHSTGNGKTSWAIKLMLKYFDTIWAGNGFTTRGLFIHTPTFLSKLKQFNVKDESFDELKRAAFDCDLVVWDDIGSIDISSYDHTQLLTYIDTRINAGKSNIYTGNLCKQELEKSLGVRLASRIYSGDVVEFIGKDMR